MKFLKALTLAAMGAALACGEDPVAALSRSIEAGVAQLSFDPAYGYLPALLDALHIPMQSQMAVFSKTSIQALRIEPSNPRVLYFNDSVVVGWVRGGFIELAAQDPGREIRYYTLQQRPDARLTTRQNCLRCHKAGATLLSSAIPAPDGISHAENDVDDRTPFNQLWGGWYVTGNFPPASHMGNAVFVNSTRLRIDPIFDAKSSLAPTSDAVALLVFAHQMRVMNLLAYPVDANEIADALLFIEEAPLPGPIKGDSGFAETFSSAGPRDRKNRSLRDLDLTHRLMRYPCSYMIYTAAFDALPPQVREKIFRRMWQILFGKAPEAKYRSLSLADRRAIVEILRDTKKDLPAWFETVNR